jgi:hypothetical protein
MTDSDKALRDYESQKYDNLVIGRVVKSLGNSMFAFVYVLNDNKIERIHVDIAKLKGKFTTKKAKRNSNVGLQTLILVSLDSIGKDKHEIYGVYERKELVHIKLHAVLLSTEVDPERLLSNSFNDGDDLFEEITDEIDIAEL